MDAEEEVAPSAGEEKGADAPPVITDADVANNPFPRVQPAAANKKGAARA